MTPYKEGKDVIIDPTIPLNKFHFGTVPEQLKSAIGKITKVQYMRQVKCDTYAVLFPGEKKELWFLEKELT